MIIINNNKTNIRNNNNNIIIFITVFSIIPYIVVIDIVFLYCER